MYIELLVISIRGIFAQNYQSAIQIPFFDI